MQTKSRNFLSLRYKVKLMYLLGMNDIVGALLIAYFNEFIESK